MRILAMRHWLTALLPAVLLVGGVMLVHGEPAVSTDKLNVKIPNFTLADIAGKDWSLHQDRPATVLVFLSFDCPVASSYPAILNELHKVYGPKGVSIVAVVAGDADPADLAKQAKEFNLAVPLLRDPKYVAATAVKAETVPEAFLLDRNAVLRYRGRIDNAWAARLRKNLQTTEQDLQRALDELLAGKDVSVPATKAVGCPLVVAREPARDGKVTYHRDVLPILQQHCQGCHRPGEVGPFSLTTYKQAANWAEDVRDYTRDRRMPPWKPADGVPFHNERRLTDKEIGTISDWVAAGTPEGDPKDAPKPREFPDGWQLGKPDLVLSPTEDMIVGPGGPDLFRVLVLPTNLDEDKYVVAFEVRPSNKRAVHHTLNFLDKTGEGRRLEAIEKKREKKPDEADRGPGYSVSMGVGFLPQGVMGGWAPGQLSRTLPEDVGYFLPKGTDVVVQVHYHRTGREERDRLQIGLYFAKKPVKYRFEGMVIPGRFIFIPANDPAYKVKGGIELQQDCVLHSVTPHMHMLGRQIKVTVVPPEGEPYSLIAIKDWDYNWQESYFLKEPKALKASTKLYSEAIYDNSARNPSNPFRPPQMVFIGEQTTNEMCFVFLGATSATPGRIKFKPQ
jgi:mono/diheme cytochrome c family protein